MKYNFKVGPILVSKINNLEIYTLSFPRAPLFNSLYTESFKNKDQTNCLFSLLENSWYTERKIRRT